ncbi:MAG: hypothetical protein LBE80_11125 [Deltaproteobacteria bacterium]|nr:hypothetical protein [Deltaproteobacteria bacterium]
MIKDWPYFLVLVLVAGLSLWAGPAWAQNSNDNFQFNELDFDRQGTGPAQAGRPASANQGLNMPGEVDPDAGLSELFSVDSETLPAQVPGQAPGQVPARAPGQAPAQAPDTGQGRLQNLPGVASPVSVPASQGEAKIELSGSKAQSAPARRRAARGSAPTREPEFRNMRERRFYYAMQAWRNHPEVLPINCQSYLRERPLYPVRCLGALAARIPKN